MHYFTITLTFTALELLKMIPNTNYRNNICIHKSEYPSTYKAFLAAKVAKEQANAPTQDPKYPLPNDMKSRRVDRRRV